MKRSAREIALQALLRVNLDQGYSNLVLDNLLKDSGLDGRDTALASALFYGVLERKLTLDFILAAYSKTPLEKLSPEVLELLRLGTYQLLFMDKIPPSAAVNETVRLAHLRRQERAAGFVNGVLRNIARTGGRLAEKHPPFSREKNLSLRYSCPEWLVKLWVDAYGAEHAEALLAAALGRPPLTARVNPLKTTVQALAAAFAAQGVRAEAVEGVTDALRLEAAGSVEENPLYREGCFHIQDTASQLCCAMLDPRPGERVIDVCAAPGGKSFTIAERMKNEGEVLSFDLHPSKVRLIQTGAARLGLSCIRAGVRNAKAPAEPLEPADRVLCDVPCSGLGILRRKPEIRYKSADLLDRLPDLQYLILCKSAELVKTGGKLFYSTCTLNPAENGEIAARFLREHAAFVPSPLELPRGMARLPGEGAHQATLMPHLHGTDGFFFAAFQKLR